MDIALTPIVSLILVVVVLNLAAAVYFASRKRKSHLQKFLSSSTSQQKDLEEALLPPPPGPTPIPFIGNLHLMAKYEDNPYEGFTELSKIYGPIYRMQMGSTPCVVVSSLESIMEILIKKGQIFDGRPDFKRWNTYFGGNRQHSLALCDWSDVQKTRRNIVRAHLMLKQEGHRLELEECTSSEMSYLIDEIEEVNGKSSLAKIPISYFAMNVFMRYMCSARFDYKDEEFKRITKNFDLIFEDINNGHPTDFLPWLSPLFSSYEKNIHNVAETVRKFILEKIIRDRPENFDSNNINDLVDALLANHLDHEEGKLNLDWQNILFALEDLLGGSSAISNVVIRVLYYISQNPIVQEKIQHEIDEATGSSRLPTQNDRSNMKYTESTILETLRHTSSPIVPHVASEDSSIGGFFIEKGTVMMINNYELNASSSLWEKPTEFIPERFIVQGQIKKPTHFMPFSTGKRSCIGSRILMNLTFVTVSSLLQRYHVSIPDGVEPIVPVGKLSLIGDGFPITFTKRN